MKKAFIDIAKSKEGHKIISEVYSHEGYIETKDSNFYIVREYEKLVKDMKIIIIEFGIKSFRSIDIF
ncbi:hypothetical protein ACV56Z_10865 [Staphylococcus aureus]